MKAENLLTRLLAVHEEYLTRGPRGHRARAVIEAEFERLKTLTLTYMTAGERDLPVWDKRRRVARRKT